MKCHVKCRVTDNTETSNWLYEWIVIRTQIDNIEENYMGSGEGEILNFVCTEQSLNLVD